MLPRKESGGLEDEDDPAKLWFANQLSDDSCASMAILNVGVATILWPGTASGRPATLDQEEMP